MPKIKIKKLWMVKGDAESLEVLFAGDPRFREKKRPAKPEDETLERLADMMDAAAESCNAHDFVMTHRGLAAILHQEVGRETATRVMRRIVNYDGLYGMTGVCGEGDSERVAKELGVPMNDYATDWNLKP